IRKVDVAIHDVSNDVPGEFGAQEVGSNKETKEVVSFSVGQKKALLTTECRALLRLQCLLNRAADRSCHVWRNICPVESRKVLEFYLRADSRRHYRSRFLCFNGTDRSSSLSSHARFPGLADTEI